MGAGQTTMIPHKQGEAYCGALFSGVKYCTKTLYADARDETAAPYFPLNGETTYVEL